MNRVVSNAERPSRQCRVRVLGRGKCSGWILPCICFCAVADEPSIAAPPRQDRLAAVLANLPHAETRVGACVIELATGKTVFALNPDRAMLPASTAKVFVMAAALSELGADFTFETLLARDAENLYLVGGGDPALGDQKIDTRAGRSRLAVFEQWSTDLAASGVTEVLGDLVVDGSIFDDELLHPTWEQSDLNKWYAAPVGGLNFNDNCVDITVAPAALAGAPAEVSVFPKCAAVTIVNKCRTGSKKSPLLHHEFDSTEYRVTGQCNKRWPFASLSFPSPGLLAAETLRSVLSDHGVTIRGTIRGGRARLDDGGLPAELTIIGRHHTPLADVLGRIGKDSQNLFAECLIKRIGVEWARRRGERAARGSWSSGAAAIGEMLRRADVDATGLRVADGSGLSRENACTPRQLAAVLAWAYARPEGRILRESLSIAGVDGSLRKRMRNLAPRIEAKTGTMKGVRTLCGYIDADTQGGVAFAIMFNGIKGSSAPYKRIQDGFCGILAAHGKR